jgi:hypothetical protein
VVGRGELVVAGGDGPELLEPVDQALDAVAVALGRPVESRTAALALLGRDDRPDAALAEALASGPAAVALVARHPLGAEARTPAPGPFDGAAVEQVGQGHLLVALPSGQDRDDRLAAGFSAEVNLRAEAALAPAERLLAPLLRAPAACWWARMTVPSTK